MQNLLAMLCGTFTPCLRSLILNLSATHFLWCGLKPGSNYVYNQNCKTSNFAELNNLHDDMTFEACDCAESVSLHPSLWKIKPLTQTRCRKSHLFRECNSLASIDPATLPHTPARLHLDTDPCRLLHGTSTGPPWGTDRSTSAAPWLQPHVCSLHH